MKTGLRAWKFDAGPIQIGIGLAILTFCSSCASRGNVEVLEAQLRSQEQQLRNYEQNMTQLRNELTTSHKEMDLLRSALAGQATQVVYEEETSSLARVHELVFNTLLTGGQDHDGTVGDERFHAVFYPSDIHGGPVKLSGHIELEAIDPARKVGDRSLGHWEYSSSEARKLWHAGFLSSGFQVSEDWTRQPSGSKVILVAKMTTLDGRQFEATHTLAVKSQGESSPGMAKVPPIPDIPAETRRVPDPEPWELDQPIPKSSRPQSESLMKQGLPPVISTQPLFGDAPEMKANGLPTSDRFTDADTPTYR